MPATRAMRTLVVCIAPTLTNQSRAVGLRREDALLAIAGSGQRAAEEHAARCGFVVQLSILEERERKWLGERVNGA